MEGREKMVGSCGTCWSKMFGNIQEDIGYMLRRAVWIGDLPRFMSFYWWKLKPWRWMTLSKTNLQSILRKAEIEPW